jgi:cyclic pyranopterin phosphate synthase
MKLTHLNESGQATMVDVSGKTQGRREARAEGRVFISPGTADLVSSSGLPKGNPFEVARLAGAQAAKLTSQIIPLCHNLPLDWVNVDVELQDACFLITASVVCRSATGVEMEALTAVSAAALTVYDMCKAVDKKMVIGEIKLVYKRK